MIEKLKPCPFCGSKDLEITDERGRHWPDRKWTVMCKNCWSTGPMARYKRNAGVFWNSRRAEVKGE